MLFFFCFGPKMHCCHVGASQAVLNPRTISTYAATALASHVLATAAGMRCQIAQVALARA
jgi:hypothetical protein